MFANDRLRTQILLLTTAVVLVIALVWCITRIGQAKAYLGVLRSLPTDTLALLYNQALGRDGDEPAGLVAACTELIDSLPADAAVGSVPFWCQRITGQTMDWIPADDLARFRQGELKYIAGETEDALAIWRATPNIDVYFNLLGHGLFRIDLKEEGLGYYELANAISHTYNIRKLPMYNDLCVYLRGAKDYAGAVLNCRYAIASSSTSDSWFLLGRAYFEQGNYDQAQTSFRKAIDLGATPYALTWQGRTSELLGQSNLAVDYYEQAIQLDPAYPWSYIFLGDLYAARNQLDEARRQYEQASLAPDVAAAKVAADRLTALNQR